jgi:hypothetical protein
MNGLESEERALRIKLLEKILKVQIAVENIEKDGNNKFHKYRYATSANITSTLKKHLQENKLVIIPSVIDCQELSVGTSTDKDTGEVADKKVARIITEYTINDVDTGYFISVKMPGDGTDTGDKGIYKALTGSFKYFKIQTFDLSIADDPENEGDGNDSTDGEEEHKVKSYPLSIKQIDLIQKTFNTGHGDYPKFLELMGRKNESELTTTDFDLLKEKMMLFYVCDNAELYTRFWASSSQEKKDCLTITIQRLEDEKKKSTGAGTATTTEPK